MTNDLLKDCLLSNTVPLKSLSDAQGWWVCSTCGAHFPVSIPPILDDGVTECSSCVKVKILSAIIPSHLKCLATALSLLRSQKYLTSQCPDHCEHNSSFNMEARDLLLSVNAFLEETSLLLMHWEKDVFHA